MKNAVLIFAVAAMLMLMFAVVARSETWQPIMGAVAKTEVAVFSCSNPDYLEGYIEGYLKERYSVPNPDYAMVLTLEFQGFEAQTYTIKTSRDVPPQSVEAACPEDSSYKKCWFIKYEEEL